MNQTKFFVIGVVSVWLISCQHAAKDTGAEDTISNPLAETPYNTVSPDTNESSDNATDTPPKFTIREGKHNLSLQWISWEEMGKAEIKHLENNKYSIVGEQLSSVNSDYLRIKGILEPISEEELIFDGTVEHQITHLNQGQRCVKKGKQIFKSTKNRKYWRMQDMQNCEGGGVTDYVDIYF